MAGDSSQVLTLIQKKMAEKDLVIREQMEQINGLEDQLSETRALTEELRKRIAELETANEGYKELKAQLSTLLGE
jgi:BMFP domain-containing protein YqiC